MRVPAEFFEENLKDESNQSMEFGPKKSSGLIPPLNLPRDPAQEWQTMMAIAKQMKEPAPSESHASESEI